MVATSIYAGLRKGELMGLRWIDVNLDGGLLTVARSYTLAPKSGKPRHVPINPELAVILRRWREQCPTTDEGLVFPLFDVIGGWRMGFRRETLHLHHYLKAAGCHVPAKPWHALRHTFASHFMMAGGNILTLQKLLGHASVEQTMCYAHLAPDFMRAEVARMSFASTVADVANLDEKRREKEQFGTQVVQEANA
jgi:integrase